MKRIFIISDYLMFRRGLESLLSQEPRVDIVGQETNIDQAMARIEETKPDVVIFYNASTTDSAVEIIRILEHYPDLKVINLNLQNNNLYLHRSRQWVVEGVEDLLTAIEEEILP